MANYYGSGRSNYVRLKNKEAEKNFEKLCGERNLTVIKQDKRFGCYADNEFGGPINTQYDENSGDDRILPCFEQEVSKLLRKGEVFVWIHIGSEKMRYLMSYALAVNHAGKTVSISTDNIYDIAKKKFKVKNLTRAEY